MKMKLIYVAGKITGECETPELMKKCWAKFEDYGLSAINTENGYTTQFPLDFKFEGERPLFYCDLNREVGFTHGFLINSELIKSGKGTWQQYMKNDITTMLACDEVHFLPDWKKSIGATLERNLAEKLGMKIVDILAYGYGTEIYT